MGGSHTGERGVFRSGDLDGAEKRVAAAYYELVHQVSLRGFGVEMSGCVGTIQHGFSRIDGRK